MFFRTAKTYTKTLRLTSEPTIEVLNETYKEYKSENPVDFIVAALLHDFAKKKLKSGFIDSPGRYEMSVTVNVPIMFWDKLYYKIERL